MVRPNQDNNSFETIYLVDTQITSFENLPDSIETIYCDDNHIISNNLPTSLETLYIDNYQTTSINNLPNSLELLNDNNLNTSVNNLPNQ